MTRSEERHPSPITPLWVLGIIVILLVGSVSTLAFLYILIQLANPYVAMS